MSSPPRLVPPPLLCPVRRFRGPAGIIALGLLLSAAWGCRDAESPTEPGTTGPSVDVAAAAAALTFYQVSGGGYHTCGVTADSLGYCWGYNESGQLGVGTDTGPEHCTGAVGPFACSTRPVLVRGGHRFRQVSAGEAHSCGVTGGFRAYCWGSNGGGALGDGTTTDHFTPVAVAGGHRFRTVDAGSGHTCGVSYPDNTVYCWGANASGQLGDGTLNPRLTPVAIAGGRRFHQVSAGASHSCGVTTTGPAFCWGSNRYGQLGDSTEVARRTRPSRVAVRGDFRQLDAGTYHTCGVTATQRAFCWGNGRSGQIGNGKTYLSFWPRAVAGGVSFTRVGTGVFFSCGEATTGRLYCWGSNSYGQLGDGTTTERLKPVAVAGGLGFAQASAGGWHTCAKTSAGAAYCWGDGFFGALGNASSGSGAEAHTPVPVLGPS
jgi:alpha-tubulin suppressor-like RCC1 family protein